MTRFDLFSGVIGPLLLLSAASVSTGEPADQQTINYAVKLGENAQCLDEVNAAREAAGLSKFTGATDAEKKLPTPNSELEDDWKKLCEYLIPTTEDNGEAKVTGSPFKSGTYAVQVLTSETPQCSETVDSWKKAYKNFSGLPPSKSQDPELYKKQDNISFVALYNPSTEGTADCRVATCTKTVSAGVGVLNGGETSQPTERGQALICMTTPDVFQDASSAPFTQEQWDKIITSLTGSASAAVPRLTAFAIVLLSTLLVL
ncbi:SAG family member [Eimeria necatrix]|uniref:SAG family member n=1 Tax=Eimeria necatrix TaxID=51315 RepID=U6MK03_9EIME|nr:SAG family member [Eimeria necatrix]CDJ64351.1 SAG family member [Eimeria necatrix]